MSTHKKTSKRPAEPECSLAEMPCSAFFEWMEENRIHVDLEWRYGKQWRLYVSDPGGHYMEDRIRVLASGGTLLEAAEKAIERNKELCPFPWQNL